jgi:hypothetical protein
MINNRLYSVLFAFMLTMMGGCASHPTTQNTIDYTAQIATTIEPLDYGRILCRTAPVANRHTCLTMVIRHYLEYRDQQPSPVRSQYEPFVLLMPNDELYRGYYRSTPFSGHFTVFNDAHAVCKGHYNAFLGAHKPQFEVRCDHGLTGTADLVLDRYGRNGLGIVELTNGQRGWIVFGTAAVSDDFRLDQALAWRSDHIPNDR